MIVEIWSDVLCPFCYIGKRHFEAALKKFPEANKVEVIWKSFQLDPDFKATAENTDYATYLQQRKGFPKAQVQQMLSHVTNMAKEAGLDFHFEKAVVANSFQAHRLLHFAKTHQRQDALKEALLEAHFVKGQDIANQTTLASITEQIGLDITKVKLVLADNSHTEDVQVDLYEAQQIGVKGVPFFVFDRKYAVSGAQPVAVFEEILQKAFAEWATTQQPEVVAVGESCGIDGEC